MKEAEFWKKYNHCPYCRFYTMQDSCGDCKWYLSNKNDKADLFYPTKECQRILDKINSELRGDEKT